MITQALLSTICRQYSFFVIICISFVDNLSIHVIILFVPQIRMWQRDSRDRTALQPTPAAAIDVSDFLFEHFILLIEEKTLKRIILFVDMLD